jgi:hypothetical protein
MDDLMDLKFDPTATRASVRHVKRGTDWYLEYEIDQGMVTRTKVVEKENGESVVEGFVPNRIQVIERFEASLRGAGWLADRVDDDLYGTETIAAWKLQPAS